jgi:hypothetical protein
MRWFKLVWLPHIKRNLEDDCFYPYGSRVEDICLRDGKFAVGRTKPWGRLNTRQIFNIECKAGDRLYRAAVAKDCSGLFYIPRQIETEATFLVDYFMGYFWIAENNQRSIDQLLGMSVNQALAKSEAWHSKYEVVDDPGIVIQLGSVNGWRLEWLVDEQALKYESGQRQHCVIDYWPAIKEGRCIILRALKGDEWLTIEYSANFPTQGRVFRVVQQPLIVKQPIECRIIWAVNQIQGYHNTAPSPEDRDFLEWAISLALPILKPIRDHYQDLEWLLSLTAGTVKVAELQSLICPDPKPWSFLENMLKGNNGNSNNG